MQNKFTPSRRQLVVGGALLAGAIPGASLSSALACPLPYQDADDWERQIGSQFAIATEGGTTPMRLIAVKGKTNLRRSGAIRQNSFTTFFEVDASRAPAGGKIYQVRHDKAGVAPIYLERSNEVAGKVWLRASFS
ncbi:MAG: hypothetical protein WDN24_13565 [Sphingomonas sp.]